MQHSTLQFVLYACLDCWLTRVFCFSGGPNQLVADFSMCDDGSVWVLDVVGRLWYTTGVKASKPQGDGQWWQVGNRSMFVHAPH